VEQFQVRLNSSKAFSLLELLVVIALLGIVSLVAVPNVREWLVKREMEKDMSTIMDLVKTIGNNLGSNLYEMGGIFFDNNNGNGLIVKVRYRGPDKYKAYQACNNNDAEWDGTDTYSSGSSQELYSTFSNIKMDVAAANFCFSKNFTANYAGDVKFCHRDKNSISTCQQVSTNDPYYDLIIQRTARPELWRYSYANGYWTKF
jgi:prepilin-type N-terminal cleavage/methylation domain-containing protein